MTDIQVGAELKPEDGPKAIISVRVECSFNKQPTNNKILPDNSIL